MSLTPWRSPLTRALHRNRTLGFSRYLQLATVGVDGKPANRTLVFRGFLPASDQLQFAADNRSQKVNQIHHCPWGEICWYFAKTREQFRIQGRLSLIDADYPQLDLQQARQSLWQKLSDSARRQFAWPMPALPRQEDDFFVAAPPEPNQPLPNFGLLLLEPQRVDHLDLRGEPHNRWLYECQPDGTWVCQAINP